VAKTDRRALAIATVVGLILSLSLCVGITIDRYGEIPFGNALLYIAIICIWLGVLVITYYGLKFVANRPAMLPETKQCKIPGLFVTQVIILICWLPVFLAEYPGFFVYDATEEYVEVATRTFTTHHPLAHVIALGGSVCAGNKIFGSFNIGIAAFIAFQAIIVSLVFAWAIMDACAKQTGMKTVEAKCSRVVYVVTLLWYCFFPTVVMFALCSVKDTLFAAFLYVSMVMTYRLTGEKTHRVSSMICLVLSLIFMMLMRRNGVYAFLIYAICVIAIEAKNSGRKAAMMWALVFFCTLASYKITDVGLSFALHADNTENQEILTVPIQQIARTWNVYKDEMTTEETEALYGYLSPEALKRYTPDLSDPVKCDFNNDTYSADKATFWNIWLSLGKKHPASYINAWFNTCYGYFYPGTVVNVYAGHEMYSFTYTESSYFGYEVEPPGERHSVIPVIDSFYRWISLDDDIQRIPIISLLFSMGGLFVIALVCMAIAVYMRRSRLLVAMSLPVAVWLTLIPGPTFLPRYTVFMWFTLPWVLVKVLTRDEEIL